LIQWSSAAENVIVPTAGLGCNELNGPIHADGCVIARRLEVGREGYSKALHSAAKFRRFPNDVRAPIVTESAIAKMINDAHSVRRAGYKLFTA
jgi:hypothetical protein